MFTSGVELLILLSVKFIDGQSEFLRLFNFAVFMLLVKFAKITRT